MYLYPSPRKHGASLMAITEQGNGKESRDDAAAARAAAPASTAGPATGTVEAADATDTVTADGADRVDRAGGASGAGSAGMDAGGMDAGGTAETDADTDADAGQAAGTARSRRPSVPMSYRDLLVDPRFRPWAQRLGAGLLAGLFVALFFGWRVGFTITVMVVVADTVHRMRMQSSVDAWQKKASSAERRTERQL